MRRDFYSLPEFHSREALCSRLGNSAKLVRIRDGWQGVVENGGDKSWRKVGCTAGSVAKEDLGMSNHPPLVPLSGTGI